MKKEQANQWLAFAPAAEPGSPNDMPVSHFKRQTQVSDVSEEEDYTGSVVQAFRYLRPSRHQPRRTP